MKIGIIGDVHWCQYSSIIRRRGEKYSLRLENCIKSVSWAENLTEQLSCSFNVYMGDFFDKPDLNSEEITALKEIKWNNLPKYFLVGNHEIGSSNLSINSSNVFDSATCKHIVEKPESINIDSSTDIILLPYILENNRQTLPFYLQAFDSQSSTTILLMHNDIAGIQLGSFVSKQGFTTKEIQDSCDLCINGHIHNGGKIADKIFNIGNLTGQNFSENARRYNHVIFILDTDTLKIDVYENPVAFNFYKEDWSEGIPFDREFKPNSILTVQTSEDIFNEVRKFIENTPNIIESRVLVTPTVENNQETLYEDLSIDHYREFETYILSNIDASEIAREEISYILQ